MMKHALIGLTLLATMLACGGGGGGGGGSSSGSSTPTLAFATTATATDNDYRFVKNASSTDTTLMLDLLGPTGQSAKGVAVFLTADTDKVDWVNPTVGSQFPLGGAPYLFAYKVSTSNLQIGIFQKGGAATTYDGTAPILTLGLKLKSRADQGTVAFGLQGSPMSLELDGKTSQNEQITINCGKVSVE